MKEGLRISCAKTYPADRGFFSAKNMFTGIIENLGTVVNKSKNQLKIKADGSFMKKISEGLSISINGICLTVISFNQQSFSVDFMPETESKTNINALQPGDQVNLELPATPETFLSGHIVQGHVDGVGKLKEIQPDGNSRVLVISLPESISKYLFNKGSVALNGISLTVIEVKENLFSVGIIPITWEKTMLSKIEVGDLFNIEVDVLAKYVERLAK